MAYIPGAGFKKPLNMLSNPIYPDIKNAPPRFRWSGKHWTADAAVMRDTEHINQFYESAVLAVPRDYNQTVYGQSSHRDIVNAAFRPPLIDPIEDIYPLTRIPATSRAIIPRINPGTAHSTGGTSGFTAKNERINNIAKHLTDRVTSGNWRATFYCPMDVPEDNSVLPDLELTIPSVSASAGFVYPAFDAPTPEVQLDHQDLTPTLDAGITTQVRLDGASGRESLDLHLTRPQVSASAGMNTPVRLDGPQEMETRLTLDYTRPQVSASAGMNTPVHLDGPQEMETRLDLEYTRPQVSASAGMNTPVHLDGPVPTDADMEFETRLEAPITVVNPGVEDGYKTRMQMGRNPEEYIHEGNPRYSYVVPATSPAYRAQNEMTYRPSFQEKLQPIKHYGQISHSSAIPQMGISRPQMLMKDRSRVAGAPKKAVYRF